MKSIINFRWVLRSKKNNGIFNCLSSEKKKSLSP